ncbi:MAG: tetratricopeptide repeat protein [Sorangiineae bacterium]|nr:tetratricopeptide repeat protein [Polyangiaceae bacterium]MEB2323925.1 tetratricopeptide repeat protein [Sorangiineae bacterium]
MAEASAQTLFGTGELHAPLIGRDAEMATLKKASDASRANDETRIVSFLGGGGLGKSRIISEYLSELRSAGGRMPRVYRGSARALPQSYGVFARLMRSRFGLVEGMDPDAAKAQVRAQVAKVLDDRKVGDVCFFLGQLMDLSFQESPLTRAVIDDPSQARLLRRAIMKSFIESDASRGPVCLVFEDLHLADDDSLELLRYLMQQLSGPLLLLVSARPELLARQEDWAEIGRGRHDVLQLRPLGEAAAEQIIRALLAPCQGGPPDALVEAAVAMAGGSPGLLEQMVRIFHDAGVLEEEGALAREPLWKVDLDKLASARLPMTVDDAVTARIGALSAEERRVLEHAGAMGSVFWLGGLVALARMDRAAPELWSRRDTRDVNELTELLGALVERDYVLKMPDSTLSDETEYVFKHNLEREKVTTLMSAVTTRRYHQTIADWLSQKEGTSSQEEYAAMFALHLERAGALTRAGAVYLDAADLARAGYAAKKANEYYARGLELLGDADARRRIDALHNHGDVLLLLGKTDEGLAAFREMLALAWRLGLHAKGGAAHNRIGRLYRDTGALGDAERHLQTALELFEAVGDERGVASCHDDVGKLLWTRGDYDRALDELKTALEMRKKLGDRRSIALSLNNIGLVWGDHGRTAKAGEAFEASLAIRREINDPLGVVQSLNNLGQLAENQGDATRALALFRESYEVAKEIGERNRIAVVLTNMGEAHYLLGDSGEAIRILKEAEELCDELGDRLQLAEAKRGLAKAYLLQKDLRKARESIKQAVDLFGQIRSRAHLAVALRTLGEITGAGAWGKGHEGKAVDYFMRSIAICKEIGNELEVAKSYRAFAEYVTASEHYTGNADIQREANKLGEMADEIFERHRKALTAGG